jgi:hypothetical protein
VTTQTTATGGNTLHNIGVASNSDLGLSTFGGVSVGANDTLAMFTYGGDANLDGSITGDDYFVIDSNFSGRGSPIPTSGGVSGGGLAGVQAVQEPASIGLIGVAAASLLARRRRLRC